MPSTVIAHMEYDAGKAVLTIRFVSGLIYEYLGVPEKIYYAMKQAGSKGKYFNRFIKGRFDFRKVE